MAGGRRYNIENIIEKGNWKHDELPLFGLQKAYIFF
jgi:hypothetical protein